MPTGRSAHKGHAEGSTAQATCALDALRTYEPQDAEEAACKAELQGLCARIGDAVLARHPAGHITVSAVVLSEQEDQILLVEHNLYHARCLPGGHADGAASLLEKAEEEVREECGLTRLWPVTARILSLDPLPVPAHRRHGEAVAAHVHYNVTFAFFASANAPLTPKPDENSLVLWMPVEAWPDASGEPHMHPYYRKLQNRLRRISAHRAELCGALPGLLLPWFEEHARDLPWRADREPYHVWLSEIMLQQTRVEAVKRYYPRFLRALPDVAALAAAPEEKLLKLWEGLGYYNRARNLQSAARIILSRYSGRFPTRYADIRALPGIGDYTAGAIASICFDAPTPAVDGNVVRVMSRFLEDHGDAGTPAARKRMEARLSAVYPSGPRAYTFNPSLMELGATVCLPSGAPDCPRCPLRELCLGRAAGNARSLPHKARRAARRVEERTVFLLRAGDAIAVEKRPPTGLLAGLWQFPNVPGRLDGQQALDQAAAWHTEPRDVKQMRTGRHIFTHVEWRMTCYDLECGRQSENFLWMTEESLRARIALPTAFRMFLPEDGVPG